MTENLELLEIKIWGHSTRYKTQKNQGVGEVKEVKGNIDGKKPRPAVEVKTMTAMPILC